MSPEKFGKIIKSPYDFEVFQRFMEALVKPESSVYAYPPNSAPLGLFLAVGSLTFADWLIGALNLAALAGLVAFTWMAATSVERQSIGAPAAAFNPTYFLIATGLSLGNPFSAHVAWMGQTSLLAAVCLLMSWLFGGISQGRLGRSLLGPGGIQAAARFADRYLVPAGSPYSASCGGCRRDRLAVDMASCRERNRGIMAGMADIGFRLSGWAV